MLVCKMLGVKRVERVLPTGTALTVVGEVSDLVDVWLFSAFSPPHLGEQTNDLHRSWLF